MCSWTMSKNQFGGKESPQMGGGGAGLACLDWSCEALIDYQVVVWRERSYPAVQDVRMVGDGQQTLLVVVPWLQAGPFGGQGRP